ncbi:MAG: uroporphyrinogen-III synthase [Halothiobacillaceae bacterium]
MVPPELVVLTRPEGRNESLAARLATWGVDVAIMPAIAIEPVKQLSAAQTLAGQDADDWVFFVSATAVRQAERLRPLVEWPAGHFVAVGRATAVALAEAGRPADLVPEPGEEETEGLLARLPAERLSGRVAWIVRGCGGRALLAQALSRMGAQVRFLELYRRVRPAMDLAALAARARRALWVITSPEGLENLTEAAASGAVRDWLLNSDLIVINERTVRKARALGFSGRVLDSGGPDDETMAQAVRAILDADRAVPQSEPLG